MGMLKMTTHGTPGVLVPAFMKQCCKLSQPSFLPGLPKFITCIFYRTVASRAVCRRGSMEEYMWKQ
jgi:hypothetical protein